VARAARRMARRSRDTMSAISGPTCSWPTGSCTRFPSAMGTDGSASLNCSACPCARLASAIAAAAADTTASKINAGRACADSAYPCPDLSGLPRCRASAIREMPSVVPIPLAMLTRPPRSEAEESAVARMMTVLLAGMKIPRPRPAKASSAATVVCVTGMKIAAHMAALVRAAPAKPRRRSPQAFGSTASPNNAAAPNPIGKVERSIPVRASPPGPCPSSCGISISGPNSVRYPQAAPISANATGADRSSHTGISGCAVWISRRTKPIPPAMPTAASSAVSQAGR